MPSSGMLRSVAFVIANVVANSLILFTPMIEAICYSETSVLIKATRRHIPKYGISGLLSCFSACDMCSSADTTKAFLA
jgi:hypothetical protein